MTRLQTIQQWCPIRWEESQRQEQAREQAQLERLAALLRLRKAAAEALGRRKVFLLH